MGLFKKKKDHVLLIFILTLSNITFLTVFDVHVCVCVCVCVCVFCLFIYTVFFALQRKNLVLLNLINRYVTSASE